MDNHHFTRSGAKRSRFDDSVNVLTSSSSSFLLNVDSVSTLGGSEYDRKSQENEALHQQYLELQSKNSELEAGHEKLQQAYQNLLVLYNSQSEHISQLPNQSEVASLKETIEIMDAAAKEHIKKIYEVEKQRDAYKGIIEEYEKNKTNCQALENEETSLKDRFDQQMKAFKKSYEQENARFHKSLDEMNAKEKNCDRMVSCEENVALEANNNELQNTQEINRIVRHEENKTLLYLRDQKLSWLDYEKLVSLGSIKSIHFVRTRIEKEYGVVASLEDVMKKVPFIETFECVLDYNVSIKFKKKAFSNLLKLPPFKNLQKFFLSGIDGNAFDAHKFIAFMKKHPFCHFSVSFINAPSLIVQDRLKTIVKILRAVYPSQDKLVILI